LNALVLLCFVFIDSFFSCCSSILGWRSVI